MSLLLQLTVPLVVGDSSPASALNVRPSGGRALRAKPYHSVLISTNAVISEGIGQAIALDTGIAPLGNMEAVQFHPTGIFPAGILVTEGCRGDGGLLLDGDRYRFMPDYEPEKRELASRDVVSRRMEQHIAAGNGARSRFGDHLWLDITLLGRGHIEKNLREVKEIVER